MLKVRVLDSVRYILITTDANDITYTNHFLYLYDIITIVKVILTLYLLILSLNMALLK